MEIQKTRNSSENMQNSTSTMDNPGFIERSNSRNDNDNINANNQPLQNEILMICLKKSDPILLHEIGLFRKYLKEWGEERREKLRKYSVRDEWNEIVIIWDRMFFWLFTFLLIIITVVLFVIVPLFKEAPELSVV